MKDLTREAANECRRMEGVSMSRKRKPNEWLPLRIEAYRNKTQGLTTQEHGAYLLLLIEYWSNQGPISSREKSLAAITRMSLEEWREISDIVLSYFQVDGDLLRNRRMDEELDIARQLIKRNRANGAKGGRPRKTQTEPTENPEVISGFDIETQKKHTRGYRQEPVGESPFSSDDVPVKPLVIPEDDLECEAVISSIERRAKRSMQARAAAQSPGDPLRVKGAS